MRGEVNVRRTVVRLSASAIVALLSLVLLAGSAGAHATLISTDPARDAVLPTAPASLTLTYTEPVTVVEDGLRLFSTEGKVASLEGSTSGSTVTANVPGGLADGSYVLSWRVISADGHPISGTLSFAIGAPSAQPAVVIDDGSDSQLVERLLPVMQGVSYVALLAIIGLAIFRQMLPSDEDRAAWPMTSWFAVLGVIAAIASILVLPLTVLRQEGRPLGRIVDVRHWAETASTDLWISLLVILICVAMADQLGNIDEASPLTILATVLMTLGVAAALTLVGHTRVFTPAWLIMASNALHVVAAAIWFGGLVGLGLYLWHIRASTDAPENSTSGHAVEVVSRFSTTAAISLIALMIAGVISAWRILPSWSALIDTDYGRLLLFKIGATGIVALLAALNRYRLVPAVRRKESDQAAWSLFSRVVRLEVAILLAVVLATGIMINQSPVTATEPPAAEESEPVKPIGFSTPLGSGFARGSFTPTGDGIVTLDVVFIDANGAAIAPVDDPVVQFSLPELELGPLDATLIEPTDDGGYRFELDAPLPGEWEVSFIVRTSRFEQPIARVTITID